jgi:hypothetical protein
MPASPTTPGLISLLGKDASLGRSMQSFGRIIAEPMVAGLHHIAGFPDDFGKNRGT